MEEANTYKLKNNLMTITERKYYDAILDVLPDDYILQPQVNLACVIEKTNGTKYHNELFRNIDFLILTNDFEPIAFIEINDNTHTKSDRVKRDKMVQSICKEAGIKLITFWTKYGINKKYIIDKIDEAIYEDSCEENSQNCSSENDDSTDGNTSQGCYIATCVYGSYNCSEVWMLRRYRDFFLKNNFFGRIFIKIYYAISPTLVKLFGKTHFFKKAWKYFLDKKIEKLYKLGYSDDPYIDK